jgi:hypothetical protein
VLGPNSATAHTSAVIYIENSINYALRVIRPLLEGKASIADVKRSAEEANVAKVHAALEDTVWTSGGCHSWYSRETEVDGKIKRWNGMMNPWWSGHFWYTCLFPVWKDWQFRVSD